jgi:hypothetical protein
MEPAERGSEGVEQQLDTTAQVRQVVAAVTGRGDEGNLFRPGQFRSVLVGLDLDRDQ